jgi:hypothetical protein
MSKRLHVDGPLVLGLPSTSQILSRQERGVQDREARKQDLRVLRQHQPYWWCRAFRMLIIMKLPIKISRSQQCAISGAEFPVST